jgi:hypothetical protein
MLIMFRARGKVGEHDSLAGGIVGLAMKLLKFSQTGECGRIRVHESICALAFHVGGGSCPRTIGSV